VLRAVEQANTPRLKLSGWIEGMEHATAERHLAQSSTGQEWHIQIGAPLHPLDEDDSPDEDGRTETEAVVGCAHCGKANAMALDPGGGSTQEFVEDTEC
jgi:hypothetical protein